MKLCQIEIPCSDAQRSLRFYAEVFAWTEAPCEIYRFHVLMLEDGEFHGLALVETEALPFVLSATRLIYKAQSKEDVDRALAAAERCGGKVLNRAKPLSGYGMIAEICDPDGQRFGIYLEI